jgi:hypothetical protein
MTTKNTDEEKSIEASQTERQEKLDKIEKALHEKSLEVDSKISDLEKREKALGKKISALSSGDMFGEVHKHVNEVYTLILANGMTQEEGYEAIRLLWDARTQFNNSSVTKENSQ